MPNCDCVTILGNKNLRGTQFTKERLFQQVKSGSRFILGLIRVSYSFSVLAQIVELNSVQLCREGEGATGVAQSAVCCSETWSGRKLKRCR